MTQYPLDELKLLYRVLHRQLKTTPELMDGDFLSDLQTHLQKAAQTEGIDIANHSAWDTWLGNDVVGCDIRMAKREVWG